MSSFFRNPNDVTDTEDQTRDTETSDQDFSNGLEDDGLSLNNGHVKSLRKIRTLDSTTSGSWSNEVSRQLTQESSSERHPVKDLLFKSLLQEKALREALEEVKEHYGDGYTKDDPVVQSLAAQKYDFFTQQFGEYGVLSPEAEGNNNSQRLQSEVSRGLDIMSGKAPGLGRPALPQRDTSLVNMRNLILSGPASSVRSLSSSNIFREQAMNRKLEAVMGLPPMLRSLVDHPLFETSRYLRDFKEIAMVGKGGYGKVYHVQHRLDGSDYAIKKISLNANRIKRIQQRGQVELDALLNELRMLAKFDHPNIVRYYGGWLEHTSASREPTPSDQGQRLIEAPRESLDSVAGAERLSHEMNGGRLIELDGSDSAQKTSLSDIDIMFEQSGGQILGDLDELDEQDDLLAELQPQIKAPRKRKDSTSTTASARSKLSSVHSAGPDDDSEDLENGLQLMRIADSSDTGTGLSEDLGSSDSKSEPNSGLTLHIQMSLHPLSLADYLAPAPRAELGDRGFMRHCFHLEASLEMLSAILDGVEYLHECGVVHRDMKPSNVFLTIKPKKTPACIDLSKCKTCADGETRRSGFLATRIGDFGLVTEIARATGDEHQYPAPSSKAVGTELYRPLSASAKPNEKLDVFALGIMLTELLVPFDTRMERHQTLQEIRGAGCEDSLLSSRFGKEHGTQLASLISNMTASNEKERPSCSEVRERIEQILL